MIRKHAFRFLLLLAASALAACSGPKPGTVIPGGGGGGNASVSLSISDTPPANTSLMSFTLPVLGVTLTPSSGSLVSVFSSNTAANYELTRLQSDSDLIATNVSVAAGTYTAINVTVAAPSAVFVNGSGATIGSCANGAVCPIQGSPATITFSFPSGSPLVLTASQNQWLDLDFNYNNAIVTTNGIGIDVTQASVLTALTTPPAGIPTGDFANVDDFTGIVTAISSSSISIKSTARGSLTASLNSSTVTVNDPQGQCSGGATFSCIKQGSVLSLQGVLTNTGVVNGTELDVIDASVTPADEVEGTYVTSGCNGASSIEMILSDSSILTSGSPLATAGFGSNVCLTLSPTVSFSIDDGILTNQGVPSGGFTNTNDLVVGQTIRAKVTNAVSGTGVINATASALILRFSRFTATVNTSTSPTFSINNLPIYFGSLTTPVVQTYLNGTIFEGVASAASLQNPQTVSISALFLNPQTSSQPFQAAKVRVP